MLPAEPLLALRALLWRGLFRGGTIGAVSGALVSGTISGIMSSTSGSDFWSGFADGAAGGFMSGAIVGGITGAVGSAVKVSQAAKVWDRGTFKSGYQSMKYHYNKHVISEGMTKGNNVIRYTQDAVNFSNRNSSVLKYTYNHNYGNVSWNFTYSPGSGGMFTSAGKIITFWYR